MGLILLTAGEHSASGHDGAAISNVLLCLQGYEGLVEGGENIKAANWLSVSNIIQLVRPEARWLLPTLTACEHVWVCTHSRTEAFRRRDLMGIPTQRDMQK